MDDLAHESESPEARSEPPSRPRQTLQRVLPLALLTLLAGLLIACGSRVAPPTAPPPGGIAPGEPVVFDAGGSREQARFDLTNTADRALAWSLAVVWNPGGDNPQDGPWFDYEPAAGTIPAGASQTLTLTLRNGLTAGRYGADLFIDFDGGRTPFEVSGSVGDAAPPGGDPDFDIRLARSALTLAPGAGADVAVELVDVREPISVEVDTAPAGVVAEIVDNGDPNDTVVLLRLAASGGAASGDVVVLARAERGGAARRATLRLTIEPAGAGRGTLRGSVVTANADVPVTPPGGLVGAPAALRAAVPAARPAFVPGQLLVAYAEPEPAPQSVREGGTESSETPTETAARARARLAAEVRSTYRLELLSDRGAGRAELLRVPAGSDPLELAALLERDPRVRYAEPNWLVTPFGAPTDPEAGRLWQLPVAGLPLAWDARRGSGEVVVAVIDSGIDLDHEDLRGAFVSPGYDFCDAFGGSVCSRDGDVRPGVGDDQHGSHVAGLVAARGNNGRGVAGAVPGTVRLLPVKVFPDYLSGTPVSAVADGIRWAAGETVGGVANPDPADILNLSLGIGSDSAVLREAVQAAQARGALLIAAAGNAGADALAYPARYPGVVSVGAINSRLGRACFSNAPGGDATKRGEHLMAPGGDGFVCAAAADEAILSTFQGNGYGLEAGTSMAAPIATGIAALLWAEQGGGASAAGVRSALLEATWFDAGAMSAAGYGRGVLRADLALGFPGPGAAVGVDASGPGSAATVVRLDPFGGSGGFEFRDLPAGAYTLAAVSEDAARPLGARLDTTVGNGETRTVRPRLTP